VPSLCPRSQIRLTSGHASNRERAAGSGTTAQVLSDLDELAAMGAEYVVLDTNPDNPHERRPVADDWRILETIANRAA
jgi:hypothetical protein